MNTKKKIAYINPDCFIDTDLTVLKHISKEFDITWIPIISKSSAYSKFFLLEYAKENNLNVIIYENNLKGRSIKNFILYRDIIRTIQFSNCDLIFTGLLDIYWTIICKLFIHKIPIVRGIHDYKIHSNFNRAFSLKVSNLTNIWFNKYFLFYSKSQQDLFIKDFPQKRSHLVGMSIKDFGKSTELYSSIEKEVKLLFFGRIESYKGLDLLITTLEKLYKKGIMNIKLSICGKGLFWYECSNLIKSNKQYNLQIRFIDNTEIPNLMMTHHFLVLPYRDTTQSGPIMIAANYGLPIIAPNNECFSNIYNKNNAILYEEGNLEQALISVSKLNNNEYENLRNKAKQLRSQFNEKNIGDKYIYFFNQVIRQND